MKAVLDLGKLARPGFELVVEVTDLNFDVLVAAALGGSVACICCCWSTTEEDDSLGCM